MKTVFRFAVLGILLFTNIYAQGPGYALQFDGVDDYVNFGHGSAFSVGFAVTYEVWINPSTTQSGFIFNKWVDFVEDKQLLFSSSKIHFYLHNAFGGSYLSSASTIPTNQFTHVAATYNGSTAKIYINGILDASKPVSSPVVNSTGDFYVGFNAIRHDFTAKFNGIIDEFRIWNVERTQSQIQSTMNTTLNGNETGLVGYWKFDEGTGSTTADITGNGSNGTISGATWVVSTAPLPVELTSFFASPKQNGVELNWTTATEVNNYGFEVQRAEVREKRSDWTTIGFVHGNGTTNSPKTYRYVDGTAKGKVFYRLKQIDNDGKFEYSQEVEVEITATPKEFALEQNYPNPFNPTTTIQFSIPNTQFVSLKVYDVIGREVATLVNEVREAGDYSVQFDASKLAGGIYFYTLKSENHIQTKKLLLLK